MTNLRTTKEQREALLGLCETATPSPWTHDEHGEVIGVYSDDDSGSIVAQFHPFLPHPHGGQP